MYSLFIISFISLKLRTKETIDFLEAEYVSVASNQILSGLRVCKKEGKNSLLNHMFLASFSLPITQKILKTFKLWLDVKLMDGRVYLGFSNFTNNCSFFPPPKSVLFQPWQS